jgi:hypothetical protein
MNRRTIVYRVLYEENNASQIRDLSDENRSRSDSEQVPTQKSKSLEGFRNEVSNILGINLIRDSGEPVLRYSPKGRTSEKGRRDIEGIEKYLSDVEAFLSEQTTWSAVRFEYARLAEIAGDEILPETIRNRAAQLRDAARKVA